MDYGVFEEASHDYEREIFERRREAAKVAVQEEIFPFLALAANKGEYQTRKALAAERISSIASRAGLPEVEVEKVADAMFGYVDQARTASVPKTATVRKSAVMACANCDHTSVDHSEGLTCSACGCSNFTPQTREASRRATAGEGGPFS